MYVSMLKKTARQKAAKAPLASKVIAVCALCLATGPVFAQLDFGLKCNIQTSALINSQDQAAGPELDYKNNVGVAPGIEVGYTFNKHFGAEINFLYSKQGQGYKGDPTVITTNATGVLILSNEFKALASSNNIAFTTPYTARIDLTYIKIPLLLRYTGNNTKKIFFSSFIGPQFDLLSSAKTQINGTNTTFPYGIKNEDLYKKTTVDAVLGLGAGMNLSKNIVLSVHLRLDWGLGDAENKSETYTLPTSPPGASSIKFYDPSRAANHNATGGGLISLTYKLVKKAKAPAKPAPGKPKVTPKK